MYKIAIVDKTNELIVKYLKHPIYDTDLVLCNYTVAMSYVFRPIFSNNEHFMKVVTINETNYI